MNISKQSIDELNSVIKLTIVKADYESRVNNVLDNYRKKVQMPGFRPGKVPASLVNKMYGKSALVDEINKLVSESLSNYISENKLNLLGEPLPSNEQTQIDFDNQEDFEFAFDIAEAPVFEAKLSKKDKLPYYKVAITDEMLDQQIKSVTGRFGQNQPIDKVGERSMVKGTFTQLDQNGAVLEDGIKTEDAVLSLAVLKDEATKASLLNATVGAELTIEPKVAFTSANEIAYVLKISQEDAALVDGKFLFVITEITEFVYAELTQELFNQIYGEGVVNSEEEFRNKVKAELEGTLEMESDYKFQLDVREKLTDKFDINLPTEFLGRWVRATNRSNEKLTEEQIAAELPKFFTDLKWQLIKSKLIEENELKIEQADVLENAKRSARIQFMQYGLTSIPDDYLEKYAVDMLNKEENRRQYAEGAMNDKVIGFIKEAVKLDEKELSRDEFNKLFDNN